MEEKAEAMINPDRKVNPMAVVGKFMVLSIMMMLSRIQLGNLL